MYIIDKKTLSKKYMQLIDILKEDSLRKLFTSFDLLVMKKRFNDARELSISENILINNTVNITKNDISIIIKNFIKCKKNKNFFKKTIIYELSKLTKLDKNILLTSIDYDCLCKIFKSIEDVFMISEFLSYDFLLLRIIDNLSLKLTTIDKEDKLLSLKNNLLKKILSFDYKKEIREKETSFLCWIDMVVVLLENNEINVTEFIYICKKINDLISNNSCILWKTVNAINYLSAQQKFITNKSLSNYKKNIYNNINDLNKNNTINYDFVINLMIKTLAKKNPSKEDFYNLFDILDIYAKKSIDDKFNALNIYKYIIENNKKQNIFCYRFVRKYFIYNFFLLIKHNDPVYILNEEMKILIMLFHIDVFYTFNRHEIFNKIAEILRNIVLSDIKLTHSNFFKYCDILDFILSKNTDISFPEIVEYICAGKIKKQRVSKKFKLSQYCISN